MDIIEHPAQVGDLAVVVTRTRMLEIDLLDPPRDLILVGKVTSQKDGTAHSVRFAGDFSATLLSKVPGLERCLLVPRDRIDVDAALATAKRVGGRYYSLAACRSAMAQHVLLPAGAPGDSAGGQP